MARLYDIDEFILDHQNWSVTDIAKKCEVKPDVVWQRTKKLKIKLPKETVLEQRDVPEPIEDVRLLEVLYLIVEGMTPEKKEAFGKKNVKKKEVEVYHNFNF